MTFDKDEIMKVQHVPHLTEIYKKVVIYSCNSFGSITLFIIAKNAKKTFPKIKQTEFYTFPVVETEKF